MSDFMSGKNRFETNGKGETIVGKVEEIKNAPQHGQKRLIIREKGSRKAASVDIPTKQSKNVERKETYKFDVEEKDSSDRYGGTGSRRSTSGFKNYYSDSAPEKFGLGSKDYMSRFGGGRSGSGRTRF